MQVPKPQAQIHHVSENYLHCAACSESQQKLKAAIAHADQRFVQSLHDAGKPTKQHVLDLAQRQHYIRLSTVRTQAQAIDLYELAEMTPRTETLVALAGDVLLDGVLDQHGSSR